MWFSIYFMCLTPSPDAVVCFSSSRPKLFETEAECEDAGRSEALIRFSGLKPNEQLAVTMMDVICTPIDQGA